MRCAICAPRCAPRSLLAPGGVLVLVESTDHFAFFDITTGLIEGWQHFADDLRGDNPLLAPEAWTRSAAGAPASTMRKRVAAAGRADRSARPARDRRARVPGESPSSSRRGRRRRVRRRRAPSSVAHAERRPARDERASARSSSALPSTRLLLMADLVRGEVIRILRLDPASPPTRRDRLMDLGMDSLMAVQLRNALDRRARAGRAACRRR